MCQGSVWRGYMLRGSLPVGGWPRPSYTKPSLLSRAIDAMLSGAVAALTLWSCNVVNAKSVRVRAASVP